MIYCQHVFGLCSALRYVRSAVVNVHSAVANVRSAVRNIKPTRYIDKIIMAVVYKSKRLPLYIYNC